MPHLARYAESQMRGGDYTLGAGNPYGWQQMSPDEEKAYDRAVAEFLRVVNGVDWNRVLLDAASRHFWLHPEVQTLPMEWLMGDREEDAPGTCGECIFVVLIQRNMSPRWEQDSWGSPEEGDVTHPGYLPKLQQAVAEGKAKIKPKGEF
jgi:hypothetical protein